jgi:hypothetical protein
MNAINSNMNTIMEKLRLPMTAAQKADWQKLLEKQLDAIDAFYRPVDKWGRSAQQQKEDAENPCLCRHPTKTDAASHNCSTCGFWLPPLSVAKCGSCGNFGKCSIWCEDNEEYWESRTWQTCRDCGVYVCGLSDHQKTCEDFIWNETHCDECGNIHAHVSRSTPTEARCWCAYDQDDLNKMDLVNRRGF